MHVLRVAVAVLMLEACGRKPEPPVYVKPPIAARYSGKVEQLSEDTTLVDLLRQNAGRAVELDVTIPEEEFRGSNDPTVAFFMVFDHCPGDEWPAEGLCTGTQIEALRAPGDQSPLSHVEGSWKFVGQFVVGVEAPAQQGLTGIELVPLRER
jgi:hypothetical protein